MAATRNPNAPRDSIEDAEPAASALDPETRARFERGETFANNPQLLKPVRPTQEAPIVPPEGALPRPLDEPGVQAPPPAAVSGAPVAPAGGPLASPGATQPAAPSPVVPSPAPSDGAAVRELSELAPALRQALPPIRLTLHYYSADPARRFVILNGARCAEGDRSSDGLKVVAIRNDGVVLEFKGESFFIARGT
jgi:general secretion pathway protein B